jgi:hypothetical protein
LCTTIAKLKERTLGEQSPFRQNSPDTAAALGRPPSADVGLGGCVLNLLRDEFMRRWIAHERRL